MTELTVRKVSPLATPSKVGTPGPASIALRMAARAERPQNLSVHELIERYMALYSGRDSTRVQRLAAWQRMLGTFTLEQCDIDLLKAARAELERCPAYIYKGLDNRGEPVHEIKDRNKPMNAATVNRYMAAISAVFTWAIEQDLTPKGFVHPCRGIKRLPESDGRVRFLDQAERTRLFEAARASRYPRLHAFVLMAMKTGARRGELLALTWRDVDLVACTARLGRTKNGDGRTLVLLPDVVLALEPFVSTDLDRYVFGSVSSKYQRPASIDSAWRFALKRSGVENFTIHGLRHCCASYMAQAGQPLNVIADVLGHRRLDMTRRYSHLTTQTKASAMLAALGGIQ